MSDGLNDNPNWTSRHVQSQSIEQLPNCDYHGETRERWEYWSSRCTELEREIKILKGGDYYHDVHCSGDRRKPMGCDGCSCTMTQQLKDAYEQSATKEKGCSSRKVHRRRFAKM